MLSVIMLNVVILSVVMLSVAMLSVVEPRPKAKSNSPHTLTT